MLSRAILAIMMSRLWRCQSTWVIRKLHRRLCVTFSVPSCFPFLLSFVFSFLPPRRKYIFVPVFCFSETVQRCLWLESQISKLGFQYRQYLLIQPLLLQEISQLNWRVIILILKDIKSVRRRGEGVGLRTYLHFAHFRAFGVDQKDRMAKSF